MQERRGQRDERNNSPVYPTCPFQRWVVQREEADFVVITRTSPIRSDLTPRALLLQAPSPLQTNRGHVAENQRCAVWPSKGTASHTRPAISIPVSRRGCHVFQESLTLESRRAFLWFYGKRRTRSSIRGPKVWLVCDYTWLAPSMIFSALVS